MCTEDFSGATGARVITCKTLTGLLCITRRCGPHENGRQSLYLPCTFLFCPRRRCARMCVVYTCIIVYTNTMGRAHTHGHSPRPPSRARKNRYCCGEYVAYPRIKTLMTNLHCGGHCIYLQEHYTSSPSLSHAHPLPPFSFFLYASTVAAPVCKILSFRFLTFHNNNKITDTFCHHHRFHHYRTTLTNIYTSTTTTTTSTTSTTTTNTRVQYFIYRTSERYLSSCSRAGCRSTRIIIICTWVCSTQQTHDALARYYS